MRPIHRGKNTNEYKNYQDSAPDLILRLGGYCSYCGMRLEAGLAVEHIQPKSLHPELKLKWENFLLACPPCNSTKGSQDINLNDYFWPDQHNTFWIFVYANNGGIFANSELTEVQKRKAIKTLSLIGLDKKSTERKIDKRYNRRREIWFLAKRKLQQLKNKMNDKIFRETIIDLAKAEGYWSIWMSVFHEDIDICNRLINEIPGTAIRFFDEKRKPLATIQ